MRLTHEAYDAMGGLEGAIAERAERSIVEFLPEGEVELRRLFLRLVRPGEGTMDTRRRTTIENLDETTERMVAGLVEARLLVAGHDLVSGKQTIDIAHEALIQSWRRLRGWVNADREFLVWRQRVTASLEGWRHADQDPGALLRGGPLVEAEHWLDSRGDDLTDDERTFVEASLEQRRSEEQSALQSRRRLVIQLAGGLLFFAVVAAVAIGIALGQAQAADRERTDAIEAFGEAQASRAEAEAATEQVAEAQREVVQLADQVAEAEAAQADAEQARDLAIADAAEPLALIAEAGAQVAEALAAQRAAEEARTEAESDAEEALAAQRAAEEARTAAEGERDSALAATVAAQAEQATAEQAAQQATTALQQYRVDLDALCPGPTPFSDELFAIIHASFDPTIRLTNLEQLIVARNGC